MRLLAVDGRKRVALGTLAQHAHYLARVTTDGAIILTPARVMSEELYVELERYAEMGRAAERASWEEPPW